MTEPYLLDTVEITKRLPHRAPFLLIDRVIAVEAGRTVTACKNVTVTEAYFAGHFPGHPVMPGVLIIEAIAQACGVLAYETVGPAEDGAPAILYFAGIESARFKRMVRPGDQLTLIAELTKRKRGMWWFEGRAEVDGKVAAQATLCLAGGKTP